MGLFKFITDIFSDKSGETMSYYTLYKKICYWSENNVFPNSYELKPNLSLPEDFWKKIAELSRLTRADGHERSISVFWAEDDWVVTSTIRGSEKAVTSGGSVLVRYVPTTRREYFRKEILVDDKLYSKKEVYYKNMPKKIEVKYLFNLHTHPVHKYQNSDQEYYGFFSLQDLISQLKTNAVLSGLVTDKLWLIFRTNQSPSVLNNYEESEISVDSLKEKIKLVVYEGEFGRKMARR